MHIYISRDIHHIVDTRVLKHTSTWALFPTLTIITIPERVTTCIFPIHLQDSKIHEDNCSVFPMLKNCSWKACMGLGTKQLTPHKSYFVALKLTKAKFTFSGYSTYFNSFKHKRENFQVLEQPYRQLID